MEFTKSELESFVDSGREVCVYSPGLLLLLKKYRPKDFSNFSSRLYYFWKNGERPVPLSIVLKLMKEQSKSCLQIESFSVGSGNSIRFRKIDFYFSYFLGLLLGDGCLVHSKKGEKKNMYHVQISFATEKEANFGRILAQYLFNVHSSIYFGRGCYNLRIYSKPLVMILNKLYQIPIGEKYAKLMVPKIILSSSSNSIAYFLKGVFDSDGNLYNYRKGKSVQLRQKSRDFLEELWVLFCKVGVSFNKPYYDCANGSWVLWSSKRELVDNFIKKIIALKLAVPE